MATVKIAYRNALANGTVSVTSSATNYSASRLYDYEVGKVWKAGATAQTISLTINSDTIDTLLIPSGHNLDGASISWQYYDGGWQVASAWTQSGSALIRKSLSPAQSVASWQIVISASSAPEISELWLTKLYSFEVQPQYGLSSKDVRYTIKNDAVTGRSTYLKFGKPKRSVEYSIYAFDDTDLATLTGLESEGSGAYPFFIIDHDGHEFFAELLNELQITTFSKNYSKYFYSTNLQIQEVW